MNYDALVFHSHAARFRESHSFDLGLTRAHVLAINIDIGIMHIGTDMGSATP
jgi:hypothetical protein